MAVLCTMLSANNLLFQIIIILLPFSLHPPLPYPLGCLCYCCVGKLISPTTTIVWALIMPKTNTTSASAVAGSITSSINWDLTPNFHDNKSYFIRTHFSFCLLFFALLHHLSWKQEKKKSLLSSLLLKTTTKGTLLSN